MTVSETLGAVIIHTRMPDNVEEIKQKLAIEDVVGSYVKLDRAGKNLRARCPFHQEKTPSFFVSPERGVYHCFGCGKGGDIFSFVEEFEGLDFRGALKVLADRAGVELTQVDPKKAAERDAAYTLLRDAAHYFEKELTGNKEALQYLADRGITNETIERFGLGYAPDGWRNLYDAFSDDYDDAVLVKVGLIKKPASNEASAGQEKKKSRYYDTFRSRIMFPITDSAGRVVAFSGRSFPEHKDAPKYLNTPETPLFNKSEILYGFDRAKGEVRRYNFAIVVEGQIDVVLAHQTGYKNTVAPLGTSLTDAHLAKLQKLTDNLVFAFDADSAGLASFKRAARLALARGFDVKVAPLPEGTDPADIISEDTETWKAYIKGALHTVDFLLMRLKESAKDERSYKKTVTGEVLPFVARITSSIDQAHFVQRVATELSVPEEAVRTELASVELDDEEVQADDTPRREANAQRYTRREALVLRILGLVDWQKGADEKLVDTAVTEKRLNELLGDTKEALKLTDTQRAEYAFEAEVLFDTEEKLVEHIEDLFVALEETLLKEKLEALLIELRKAEEAGDQHTVDMLIGETQELAQKIEQLKGALHHAT